jgi:hypothetical protein
MSTETAVRTWWFAMRRWTLGYQKKGCDEPLRSEDVRRRSSGLRYWILVPVWGFLVYLAVIWAVLISLSVCVHRLASLGRGGERAP